MQGGCPEPGLFECIDAAHEIGGLDENLWYTADWDFWLKIASRGESLYYPRPLSGFRVHADSQTIKRSASIQDFREQLERVFLKHLLLWDAPKAEKNEIEKIARFSIEANIFLATTYHKKNYKLARLLAALLKLGPRRSRRYFRDSRIAERLLARMRARLENR